MLHDSTKLLIVKLHELTVAGQLDWREGDGASAVFETEGYMVEVEPEAPSLRVLTIEGKELERAGANELNAEAWPGGDGTFASRVSDMGRRAHRVARGAERAIATILSALSAPASPAAAAKPTPTPQPEREIEPEPVALQLQAPRSEATTAVAAVADKAQEQAAHEALVAAEAPQHAVLPNVDRPAPAPEPAPQPQPKVFGNISGFAKALPQEPHTPARQPEPPQPPRPKPYGLSMTGFSATTRQNPRGEDLEKPKPAPADVYKPWS